MAKYVIENSHTPEECLNALDEIVAKGPEVLDKFVWGCEHDVHTGWAYIEANNKEEVNAMIPESVKAKTKITEVTKFTPEQIKTCHEQ